MGACGPCGPGDALSLDEERQGRYLRLAVIFLIVFTVILLAAMTGLTYVVVATLKDTEVGLPSLFSKFAYFQGAVMRITWQGNKPITHGCLHFFCL